MRASARDVPQLRPYYRQSACSSSWSATSKMLCFAPQHATGAATCRRAAVSARLLLSLQPLKLLWSESVRHPHIHSDAIEHGHSPHKAPIAHMAQRSEEILLIAQTCT